MSRIPIFICALSIVLIQSSCSTDFNITGEWNEVGIVYGLLDQADSVQYIKINKAFLDENTSALDIAQIADSIYYQDSLNVTVEEYDVNGNIVNIYTLPVIDGNSEIGFKDPGVFVNSPNYLYKLATPLNENNHYILNIKNINSGKVITGETDIVNDFLILGITNSSPMNILPNIEYGFAWRSAKNSKSNALTLNFYYNEIIASDTTLKKIEWVLFSQLKSNGTSGGELLQFSIQGEDFYRLIANNITPNLDATRTFSSIELEYYAGSENLDLFIDVEENQSGLTAGQIQPNYTNLSGDALGIFSSRYHKSIIGLTLTPQAFDSLSNSSITSNLGF